MDGALDPESVDGHQSGENVSSELETTHETYAVLRPMLSERIFVILNISLFGSLITLGCLGLVANSLVSAVYLKIGFSEPINMSYFALSISDAGVLATTVGSSILNLLYYSRVDLPFHAFDMLAPTVYWPGHGFEKTASSITAYIALERCLCVLFPLHVKSFVTRKTTRIVLVTIALLVFAPSLQGYACFPFEWRFDPTRNKTILHNDHTSSPSAMVCTQFLRLYYAAVIHFIALGVAWISTIFLAISLRWNEKAKEAKLGQTSGNSSQNRNKRVAKTVLSIAGIYLALSSPKVLTHLVFYNNAKFLPGGVYVRTYFVSLLLGSQLKVCNSSINVFIYMKMNPKFKELVKEMLCLRIKS